MNKKSVPSVLFIFTMFVSLTSINPVSAFSQKSDENEPAMVSNTIVISQVYGAGGNAGATYQFDYIELFNRSSTPQSLNGLAIQYGSATGDFGGSTGTNVFALPNVVLQPGQYFLIQLATSGSVGAVLPVAADAVASNINLSGSSGKVALTNVTTGLGCGTTPCAANDARIIDLVSYGTANNAEGGAAAGGGTALTSTQGIVRNGNGCTDTDNNNADFTVVTNPVPRNTASPLAPCGGSGGTPRRVPFDFTGDGRTDWATVNFGTTQGASLRWKVTGNPASSAPNAAFKRDFDYGFNTDAIVAADYVGDRKTDVVVWRRGDPGVFYVAQFPIGTGGIVLDRVIRFGGANDIAVEGGDYDGDGKADYTVVRLNSDNSLTWFIKSSNTGAERAIPFGTVSGVSTTSTGAINIQLFPGADFTGDGRDELVYAINPDGTSNVTYFVGDAVTGVGVITRTFGNYDTDTSIAPADYTGDSRADFVAVRQNAGAPATWFINNAATNATTAFNFGIADPTFANSDIPVRSDYDGDGRHDVAVYRRSNQMFYYLRSSSGNTIVDGQKHGDPGDFPLGGLTGF